MINDVLPNKTLRIHNNITHKPQTQSQGAIQVIKNYQLFKRIKNIPLITLLFILSSNAFAAGGGGAGMPWETPLQNLLASLSGPVAQVLGTMAIIFVGLGLAFSEGGGIMRKLLWVVFGLSLAFAAATWGLPFLGFGGGATI